jgi:CheY-like chemotaxis protein
VSVLLAEDDSDIRDVLAEVLRGEGYDVLEAANGLEALKLAVETPPDIVVTDLMMPMMDGRALIGELKSRDGLSSVPIIVITAYRGRAEGLAADRTLPKPFDLDELTATIRELSPAA